MGIWLLYRCNNEALRTTAARFRAQATNISAALQAAIVLDTNGYMCTCKLTCGSLLRMAHTRAC